MKNETLKHIPGSKIILDFVTSYDVVIADTCFRKRIKHLTTRKSK